MSRLALKSLVLMTSMTSLPIVGCVVIGGACLWGCSQSAWKESTETLAIDPAGLNAVEVRTHNGAVAFAGQSAGGTASVVVRKKAGGRSQADAAEALDAIVVYNERTADGRQRIGWKWSGSPKSHWQADVSFEISAPVPLAFDAETHNGGVTVAGLIGDAKIVTYNGGVRVESREGSLDARTQNGQIVAEYEGSSVSLVTYNGGITADLSRCGTVRGGIETHNGSVVVSVGAGTSAEVSARTQNGAVVLDAPFEARKVTRTNVDGKLGSGGGRLELVTHNGQVRIKNRAG